MKVDKLDVRRVFDINERKETPLFQRPYVWDREKNWEPLLESIETLANKRLKDETPLHHFLGTIVLSQVQTQTGRVARREIIDGQQRLATLQVALAAASDLCSQRDETEYAKEFRLLTDNNVPTSKEETDTFKVWPTNADRKAYRAVMEARSPEAVKNIISNDGDSRIPRAYIYFYDAFRNWFGDAGGDELRRRIEILCATLKEDLTLVVIDLEEEDDAQVIFETLNALGTPLLPADLVKNYLFRLADAQGENTEDLYQRLWNDIDVDQNYWRQEIRQGRLKRSRIDLFLGHYLTLMRGEEVVVSQLFSSYKEYVNRCGKMKAKCHMERFREYANIYHKFDQYPADSFEERFFCHLKQMDTAMVLPILLEVFKRYGDATHANDLKQILSDLESYLVRRAVCHLTPKNYNKFFAEMAKTLWEKDDFSPSAVREHLLAQEAETTVWPDDEFFNLAWLARGSKRLGSNKQRMILESLNDALYSGKTESIHFDKKLTVEHLLPQKWQKHWPLPNQQDEDAKQKALDSRNNSVHSFGNLTLLTKKLNPAISNGPWGKKRSEILKHSALNLNRALPEKWNEIIIKKRSEELLNLAITAWPHPTNNNEMTTQHEEDA